MKLWLSFLFLSLLATPALSQTISYVPITNDADSGISAAKTYTHALDFGTNPGANVNGVAFTQVNNAGNLAALSPNFSYTVSTSGVNFHGGNGNHNVTGSVVNLFQDMIFNGNNAAGGDATITLRGLLRGAEYEQRIYTRQWGVSNNRVANITFSNGLNTDLLGGAIQISQDNATVNPPGFAADNQAYALTFQHTAGTSQLSTTFDQLNSNQSWHLYGFTNELVDLGNSADYIAIDVFNTGVDGSGNVLAPGAADPHWTLTQSPQDNIPPSPAVDATVALNHPAWSTNDPAGSPGSSWVSATSDGQTGIAPGDYIYTTQFDLAGLDVDTALLELAIQSDNAVNDILLNGVSTGLSGSPGFAQFQPFFIDTGFMDGINTLDIVVNNAGTGANAGGLRLQISGSALAAPVPEPASAAIWSILGLGFAGFGYYRIRRKK